MSSPSRGEDVSLKSSLPLLKSPTVGEVRGLGVGYVCGSTTVFVTEEEVCEGKKIPVNCR